MNKLSWVLKCSSQHQLHAWGRPGRSSSSQTSPALASALSLSCKLRKCDHFQLLSWSTHKPRWSLTVLLRDTSIPCYRVSCGSPSKQLSRSILWPSWDSFSLDRNERGVQDQSPGNPELRSICSRGRSKIESRWLPVRSAKSPCLCLSASQGLVSTWSQGNN